MEYDTELSSWFIVQLLDQNEEVISEILWGIILYDLKGRFPKGNFVKTSEIIKKYNDEYVQTLNTVYKLKKGAGETVKLPFTTFTIVALKSGYSPLYIKNILNGVKIH